MSMNQDGEQSFFNTSFETSKMTQSFILFFQPPRPYHVEIINKPKWEIIHVLHDKL